MRAESYKKIKPSVAGSLAKSAKLCECHIPIIKRLLLEKNWPQKEVAAFFNVNPATIHAVMSGKNWSHVKC